MSSLGKENRVEQAGDRRERHCPVCGKLQDHAFRPFCSKRCADVDLGRWFGGHYVIAGDPVENDGDGDRSDEP